MNHMSENQEKQEVPIRDKITSITKRDDSFLKNEQKCQYDDNETRKSHKSTAKIEENEIKNYIKSIKVPQSLEEKVQLILKILEIITDYGKNLREIIDRRHSSRPNCELQKLSVIQHKTGPILREIEKNNTDQVRAKKIKQDSDFGSCNLPHGVKWTPSCPNVKLAAKCFVTLKNKSEKTKENGNFEETEDFRGLFEVSELNLPISGFQWMKILHQYTANGVLAHETGLTKTIQAIAMIAYLISKNSEGPFLIIAPFSRLLHWISEFKVLVPKVPVMLFDGINLQNFQMNQNFKIQKLPNNKVAYPVALTSHKMFMKQRILFSMFKWRYVVVDQGNNLNTFNSKLINVLHEVQSGDKLMLTGTTLQNNFKVLCSLLRFVIPEIVDTEDKRFLRLFDDFHYNIIAEQELKKDIISKLHLALNSFTLKMENDDLKLPPKKEVVINCPMSQVQWKLFNATLDGSIRSYLGLANTSMAPKRCLREVSFLLSDISEGMIFERMNKRMRTQNKLDSHNVCNLGKSTSHSTESEQNYCLDANSSKRIRQFPKDLTGNPCSINLNMGQPIHVCRKLSNHPYLIQWPIDNKGELLVDEDMIYKSGKMMVLDELLPYFHASGHRVLLFSCLICTLDILEVYVRFRGYKYVKLDHRGTLTQKLTEINKLLNTDDVFLFLVSTRTSIVGLNLVRADTIIFFDTDPNAQVDLLAQELCHRIGQTKPVLVYRFLTKSSIDEKLAERLQSRKSSTSHHRWDEGCQHLNEEKRTSVKELSALISSKDYSEVVIDSRSVFSIQEIHDMLDRSDMI